MPDGIKVIGLTGGIASGKSTVAGFFTERGVPVIDADQLAREVVLPGTPALARIIGLFGNSVLTNDGQLDRKQMRELIFTHPEKRLQLEEIIHPEIKARAEKYISEAASAGYSRIIYMAPLLIEAGSSSRVDEIWVVTVRPDIQLDRLMRRDGISFEQARLIIGSQMPLADKEQFGKIIIDNSGSEADTRNALEAAWAHETGSNNE